MSSPNLYRATLREAIPLIIDILEAGLVPNIIGSPAIGKSSIVKAVFKHFNLKLIDIRLSTCAPEDMSGLPFFSEGIAKFMPFDTFPLQGMEVPAGYQGWGIFYDEFNSGSKLVQAASYKVILDRMVAQSYLHERCVQVCAGNLMTDRAITNSLSTAMQSRLVHIEVYPDCDQFIEDVCLKYDWDERIIAYLNYDTNAFYDFKPDHQDKTFASPRTWEFMNKMITGKLVEDKKTIMYAGAIGTAYAPKFVQFCNVYKTLATIKDVLADPEGINVHTMGVDSRWALVSHLLKKIDKDNFEDVTKFINRLDLSFKILFYRGANAQHSSWVRQHPAYIKAVVALGKYIRED